MYFLPAFASIFCLHLLFFYSLWAQSIQALITTHHPNSYQVCADLHMAKPIAQFSVLISYTLAGFDKLIILETLLSFGFWNTILC